MSDLFQDKAKDWDARDLPRQLSAGIGGCIVEQVELRDDMKVMDFGAGTGLITGHLAPRVGRITAVDVSEAMLAKLADKEELRGKVNVVCQNILDQPLEESFDLIVSAMAMHHVKDTKQLAERFVEHLAPGGHVALADLDTEDGSFHPPGAEGVFHAGFDREALGAILIEAGLTDVHFHTALTVDKEGKSYPVFVVVATKG